MTNGHLDGSHTSMQQYNQQQSLRTPITNITEASNMAVAAAAAAAAANAFQQSLVASNVTPGYLQFPVSYRFFINIIVTFTARSQFF